jgi:hypothetical protein
MQEQLPSLHVVNEHFFGKFNDARASEVIFQSFPKFLKRLRARSIATVAGVVSLIFFTNNLIC